MMNSQRSDTVKNNLIGEGKKVGIDGVIKHHEIINNVIILLKGQKNIESIKPRVSNNGKTTILSKCAVCGCKESRFIKKQEASGILSN